MGDGGQARATRGARQLVSTGGARTPWWKQSWFHEALWALGAALTSFLTAAWVLQLWDAPLRVPFVPNGDSLLGFTPIKNMLENGWYLFNPSLGAPHGSSLWDFAALAGDLPQWAGMRLLGFVIPDPVLLMNAWFLLGFATVGGASFFTFRALGISRLTGLVLAVLIAVLPYHFFQGQGHLMLAGYVAVPATCWLVMRLLMGLPMVTRRPVAGWRRFTTWGNASVVLACIVAGGTSLYYSAFALILIPLAALVQFLARRDWRLLFRAGQAWLLVLGTMLVTFLPAIIHRFSRGANPAAATRQAFESDFYSFGLGQLLFSTWWHRLPPMREVGQRYLDGAVNLADPGVYLGALFGVTFVGSVAALLVLTLRGRWPGDTRSATMRAAITGSALVFLLGSFGGIGSVIAHLVTPQIRVWTRITPFLAFFCAIALGLAIDWARRKLAGRSHGRIAALALPLLIGAIGILDQTSPGFAPRYAQNAELWGVTKDFVGRIEDQLPDRAMVLQLPLHAYPEGGNVNNMGDYDHLFGYAHSSSLKWSYGSMKGRPEDWGAVAVSNGIQMRTLLIGAAAAGFDAVWVDRAAYRDNGVAIDATIRSLTGDARPITSEGDRWALYGLRPLQSRLVRTNGPRAVDRAGAALVTPTTAVYGAGFYGEERSPDGARWRWAERRAELVLHNPSDAVQVLRWRATLSASPGSRVHVTTGKATLFSTVLVDGRGMLDIPLKAQPGTTTVTVLSTGANQAPPSDPRQLHLNLSEPTIVNQALSIEP